MQSMIQNVNDPSFNQLIEARRAGHKFMKIYLHRDRIGQMQRKISICGAVTLIGYKKGVDGMGLPKFDFREVRGESMVFEFDYSEREFICWLYDDPGPGYFSKTGYNRDLLASHWEENFFIIQDPELYADIHARYKYHKANPTKTVQKKGPVVDKITTDDSIQDIDAQMAFLQAQKDKLVEVKAEEIKKENEIQEAVAAIESKEDPGPEEMKAEMVSTAEKSETEPEKTDAGEEPAPIGSVETIKKETTGAPELINA